MLWLVVSKKKKNEVSIELQLLDNILCLTSLTIRCSKVLFQELWLDQERQVSALKIESTAELLNAERVISCLSSSLSPMVSSFYEFFLDFPASNRLQILAVKRRRDQGL